MNIQELEQLIAAGEDSFTEFKRDVSQRSAFAGEMIAFANTDGGTILVGIADDGSVAGISEASRTEEAITNIARDNCVPALSPVVEKLDVAGRTVLAIHIPRRAGPPHENNSGQCFIRVGSIKRLATPHERARLLQAAGMVYFDETPVPRTSLDDLDLETFGSYYLRVFEKPLETAGVPLPRMLANMRFLVTDFEGQSRLSVAGLLLFGAQPQDYLYHSRLSAVRWAGNQAGEEILDRQEIAGRLPEIVERAESFTLRNTRLSTRIEAFQQEDRYEYPRAAVREVVLNAVAHRDYSLSGAQILLFIFDNRIEVRSPGRLPNGVTLENIRTHFSRPRNEIIARVLFNLGYVNILGSGIPRVIRLMREHSGRDPEFEVTGKQFLARLWARNE